MILACLSGSLRIPDSYRETVDRSHPRSDPSLDPDIRCSSRCLRSSTAIQSHRDPSGSSVSRASTEDPPMLHSATERSEANSEWPILSPGLVNSEQVAMTFIASPSTASHSYAEFR